MSKMEESFSTPFRRALMLSGKTAEAVNGHIQRVAADRDADGYFEQQDCDAVFVPRFARHDAIINGVHCISWRVSRRLRCRAQERLPTRVRPNRPCTCGGGS